MKTRKYITFLLALITVFVFTLSGCESNTVSNYIISNQQYPEKADLENASQPEQLTVGKDVYASVYFIESPKGMEYTAKWYIDGKEIKSETQAMLTDKHGVIVFSLEKDKVTVGTLKFEVNYNGEILTSREIAVVSE